MVVYTANDIPDLTGKTIVVTGANSGLGLESTRVFASKGAHVFMACRKIEKAEDAIKEIKAQHPDAKLTLVKLDLASQESIRECVEEIKKQTDVVDVLLNNAGLGAGRRKETSDGFEWVVGINHFGTYSMTIHMLNSGLFEKSEAPRVVIVSSEAHRNMVAGKIDLEDIDYKNGWSSMKVYGQSKLCNLFLMLKLTRVLKDSPKYQNITVLATHPGLTATPLNNARLFGMALEKGALGNIISSTHPDMQSGTYVGPGGGALGFHLWGYPKSIKISKQAQNKELQDRLWEISIARTGVELQ